MEERDGSTRIATSAQLQDCGVEMCITREAWSKLMGYCKATDLEVSGFILIERDEDFIMVTDCFIPEQVSTGTSTEMDSNSIAKLQMDLFKRKIIGHDDKVKLGHFHTHPTFNVFWSGTDMEMRETLRKGTDYYVSLVINQKGDALAAIDINGDFPMSISSLPIEIMEDGAIAKACKLEVKAKVSPPAVVPLDYQLGLDDPPRYYREKASKKKETPWWMTRDERLPRDPDWLREAADRDARNEVIAAADDIFSNEKGTFANVAGEIVKLEGPNGEPA